MIFENDDTGVRMHVWETESLQFSCRLIGN
jgi:hypothetical protein